MQVAFDMSEVRFDTLDASFKMFEPALNATESGSHLGAQFARFVTVCSYLDGNHVEELQDLRFCCAFQ